MAAVAIPVVLLGSLYILSQQENKDKNNDNQYNENFANYNDQKVNDFDKQFTSNETNQYYQENQHTDNFLQPNNYNKKVLEENPNNYINSMNGNMISDKDFKHNNMQPYFGAKIRGNIRDLNISESILDNKQGTGSQQISKSEQAPLFKPNENMEYQYGAPNNNDFFQSRVNESMKISNVSTTQPQMVGPGLGLGYGTQGQDGINQGGINGSGGFNSGMMAREQWQPKTVDDYRVANNPKVTFDLDGHQGPALNPVKNTGIMGTMERHLPEKFYENTQNRWFTTTGIEKSQPVRSTQILPLENRADTSQEYYGIGNNTTNTQNLELEKDNYRESNKINLGQLPYGNASMSGKQNPQSGEYGKSSYNILNNNRTTTKGNEFGALYGMAKAALTPLLDVVKTTRRENTVGNIRQTGNVGMANSESYVYNPYDKTRTTNREMTTNKIGMNYLNVQNQLENNNMAQVSQYQPIENQRDSTNYQYIGAGGNSQGLKPYNSVYNVPNNFDKTSESRPNHGSTQIFAYNNNVEMTRDESMLVNNRNNIINGGPTIIPSSNLMGEVQGMQTYSQQFQDSRMDADLLTAFKKNPYTQSLNSVA